MFENAERSQSVDNNANDSIGKNSGNPIVSFTLGRTTGGLAATKHHRWNDDRSGVITESPVFPVSGTLEHVECALLDIPNQLTSQDQFLVLGVAKGSKPGDIRSLITDKAVKDGQSGIARTSENFLYPNTALLMVDVDIKDGNCVPNMPHLSPEEAINLLEVVLNISIDDVARLIKPSASANLFDEDGKSLKKSSGFHIYMALKGCDPAKFHEVVHKRLVIKGHGHTYVAGNGSLLIRTPFDATVGQTNRVDFFAEPVLDAGIVRESKVVPINGGVLDLSDVDLGVDERRYRQEVAKLKTAAGVADLQKIRQDAWITLHAKKLETQGIPANEAQLRSNSLASRVAADTQKLNLYPEDGVVFRFDSGEQLWLEELLDRADEFDGQTLSDPFDEEGVRCKAKFYSNKGSGVPIIHSFAHGERNYVIRREPPLIDVLNTEFAVIKTGNRVRVMCHKFSPQGKPDFDLLTSSDFTTLLRNYPSPDGEMPASSWFLSHPDRREFDGIVFEPNLTNPKFFNLWQGFAVEAIAGSCTKFKTFVFDVICDKDQSAFEYLWGWCSYMVQYPEKMPGVAIVLMGGQGTGKNTFVDALGHLVGDHYLPINRMEQVTGRFNAHMKSTLLLHANEAMWGGSKSDAGALKALITDNIIPIEFKGKDIVKISNHVHLIVSSNEDWPVPSDADDRRFFVLKVSSAHQQDHSYFGPIRDELENGGYEALLYELSTTDLSKFTPMSKPRTNMGVELKIRSLDPYRKWIYECLQAGEFSGIGLIFEPWIKPCTKADLAESFKEWSRTQKVKHPDALSEQMKKLKKTIPTVDLSAKVTTPTHVPGLNGKRIRVVKFPDLATCRVEFERSINAEGLIDWTPVDPEVESDES